MYVDMSYPTKKVLNYAEAVYMTHYIKSEFKRSQFATNWCRDKEPGWTFLFKIRQVCL